MLITLSRRAAICQSVAGVQLIGVAPLGDVSHIYIILNFVIIRFYEAKKFYSVTKRRICLSSVISYSSFCLPSLGFPMIAVVFLLSSYRAMSSSSISIALFELSKTDCSGFILFLYFFFVILISQLAFLNNTSPDLRVSSVLLFYKFRNSHLQKGTYSTTAIHN